MFTFFISFEEQLYSYYLFVVDHFSRFLAGFLYYVEILLIFFSTSALTAAAIVAYFLFRSIRQRGTERYDETDELTSDYTKEQNSNRERKVRALSPSEHRRLLDYYACLEILGLSAGANIAEIKRSFRRLAREYHPDTLASPEPMHNEKLQIIKRAYDKLVQMEQQYAFVSQRANTKD